MVPRLLTSGLTKAFKKSGKLFKFPLISDVNPLACCCFFFALESSSYIVNSLVQNKPRLCRPTERGQQLLSKAFAYARSANFCCRRRPTLLPAWKVAWPRSSASSSFLAASATLMLSPRTKKRMGRAAEKRTSKK